MDCIFCLLCLSLGSVSYGKKKSKHIKKFKTTLARYTYYSKCFGAEISFLSSFVDLSGGLKKQKTTVVSKQRTKIKKGTTVVLIQNNHCFKGKTTVVSKEKQPLFQRKNNRCFKKNCFSSSQSII